MDNQKPVNLTVHVREDLHDQAWNERQAELSRLRRFVRRNPGKRRPFRSDILTDEEIAAETARVKADKA